MPNFQGPTFASNLFVCPHCNGYTQHTWHAVHRNNVNFIPEKIVLLLNCCHTNIHTYNLNIQAFITMLTKVFIFLNVLTVIK